MPESIAEVESAPPCGPIPRGEKRRREIALVAERVFFESGFSDTTMQMIAIRAGASKETLYRHFGSKEGLFAEIVEAKAKSFLDGLDESFERRGSVADGLAGLGLRMLEAMVDETAILLCRTVVAEASRSPELGEIFFARGPDRVLWRLSEFLAAAHRRGELICEDPELAGRIFIGAIISSHHLKRLCLPDAPRLKPAQVQAHVDAAVDMFLARYARR